MMRIYVFQCIQIIASTFDFMFKGKLINSKQCVSVQIKLQEYLQNSSNGTCLSLSTNIRLVAYPDDWLIVNSSQEKLLLDRERVFNLLLHLGFIINKTTSQ